MKPCFNAIGHFAVPSVSCTGDTYSFSGPLDDIFDQDALKECTCEMHYVDEDRRIPQLVEGLSVFHVEILNSSKKVIRESLVMVKRIITYTYDSAEDILMLKFTYTDLYSTDRAIQEGPKSIGNSIITHVFEYKGFLCVLFEGEREFVLNDIAENYQRFVHGTKVYHTFHAVEFNEHFSLPSGSIGTLHICAAILAYPETPRPRADFDDFLLMMCEKMNDIYGIEEPDFDIPDKGGV